MKLNVKHKQLSESSLRGAILARLDGKYRAYKKDEEGGIAIIAFFIFLLMVTMGGISIDLMNTEMQRTQLQATRDSAVLAGAGAPADATTQDIKNIVQDFFVKSGQDQYLLPIEDDDINATLNARRVSIKTEKVVNTYLMKLMGVDTISLKGAATAAVRTPKLEIIMVLDVSGSMAGSRLTSLKTAAKEFVTTVLNSSDPGSTLISIVPYSWGVTPSEGMFKALNTGTSADGTHDYSNCIYFEDDDYLVTAIDTTTKYKQRIHTSRRGTEFDNLTQGLLSDGWSANYNRTCFDDPYFEILPFSINETLLHEKIDGLQAAGSTSAHLGMKWAAGMLDPAFNAVASSLQISVSDNGGDSDETIETGEITEVDTSLANIPASYTEPDTQKVIVLMGDGQNDSTYMFPDPNGHLDRSSPTSHTHADYRGPGSYLHYIVETEEVFDYAYDGNNHSRQWHGAWVEQYCYLSWLVCVYDTEYNDGHYVYNPNDDRYYATDYTGSRSAWEINNLPSTYTNAEGEEVATRTQYSWEEAWGRMSPRFVAELTGNWAPYNAFVGNVQTTSDKDDKMENICNATKAEGVLVYTIGFEVSAGDHAEGELRDCASDTTKYYRASLVSISKAFGSIASNVQNLRLTQ